METPPKAVILVISQKEIMEIQKEKMIRLECRILLAAQML